MTIDEIQLTNSATEYCRFQRSTLGLFGTNGAFNVEAHPNNLRVSNNGFTDLGGATTTQLFNVVASNVGTTVNPQLLLVNDNTTAGDNGLPCIEMYKRGRNAVAGEVIAQHAFTGKDNAGTKTEFARMEVISQNVSSGGNKDGSIVFKTLVNNTFNTILTLNGSSQEIEVGKAIDLNSNAINTSSGNINLTATNSTGNGEIILTPKVVTGTETIRIPLSSVSGDDCVIEKSANATTFYQTGSSPLTNNAQMRLGYGGLRLVTNNSAPTFGLDNGAFQTATHQFSGTNYDISLPSTGSFSLTNVSSLNLKGSAINTSTGNIAINSSSSAGTGSIDITAKSGSVVNINSNVVMNNSEQLQLSNATGTFTNSIDQGGMTLNDTATPTVTNQNINNSQQSNMVRYESTPNLYYFNKRESTYTTISNYDGTSATDLQIATLDPLKCRIQDNQNGGTSTQERNQFYITCPYNPLITQTGFNRAEMVCDTSGSGTSTINLTSGEDEAGSGAKTQVQLANNPINPSVSTLVFDGNGSNQKTMRMTSYQSGGGYLQYTNSVDTTSGMTIQSDTDITIQPNTTTGVLAFTGAALQSNTSGGNSGEHLCITLNGIPYKIALLQP